MKKENLKLIILVPTILLLKRVSLFKLLYNILVIAFLRQKIFSMGYEQIRIIGKNLRDTPTYNGINKIFVK